MAHLIDKDALVAEIEKLLNDEFQCSSYDEATGFKNALTLVKESIDTLEVKEVDFEKETKKWWKEHLHLNPENKLWMDAHQSVVFAKHFFELGMSVSNKVQKGEKL